MKIGYPCINRSVGCSAGRTFRLASFSRERLVRTAEENFRCLGEILRFNRDNGLLFLRIGSGLIPFASHPVCRFDWRSRFKDVLRETGTFIRRSGMRISMHPDQFVLINSPRPEIVGSSIAELEYHGAVLDGMGLGPNAKIQIHVGGVYGDRPGAVNRFVESYRTLGRELRARLVIENDDRLYSLKDCLALSARVGVPVLFDSFHHACLNNGEPLREAVRLAGETWRKKDGCLMIDYSEQAKGKRRGSHAEGIDVRKFRAFLEATAGLDADVMLEIKDKEKSALKALAEIGRRTD